MAEDFPESINNKVPHEETRDLIASDKVEGTPVYNLEGERIGHVRNVMLDKETGVAEYAVMSFGGFLGIGERYHPIPWKALKYDRGQGGYVVGLDKEKLRAAPAYDPGEYPLLDPVYAQHVYGYYGVPWAPYVPGAF